MITVVEAFASQRRSAGFSSRFLLLESDLSVAHLTLFTSLVRLDPTLGQSSSNITSSVGSVLENRELRLLCLRIRSHHRIRSLTSLDCTPKELLLLVLLHLDELESLSFLLVELESFDKRTVLGLVLLHYERMNLYIT